MTHNYTTKNWFNRIIDLLQLPTLYHRNQVNFNGSIWQIVWQQKFKLLLVAIAESFIPILSTTAPFIFAKIFAEQNYAYLWWFFLIFGVITVTGVLSVFIYGLCLLKIVNSVRFSANKFFLTTDPIHHTLRSSGQILSKVARGSDNYEKLLEKLFFSLFYLIVSLVTTFVVILQYEFILAAISFFTIFLTIASSVIASLFINKQVVPLLIKAEDDYKAVELETLFQNNHIRSTFATPEQLQKVGQKIDNKGYVSIAFWTLSIGLNNKMTRLIYFAGIILIGYMLLDRISNGLVSQIEALAIITILLSNNNTITRFGRELQAIIDSHSKIKDLYSFVSDFGQPTYPVLESDLQPKTTN